MDIAKHNKIGVPRKDSKAYMKAWRGANLERKRAMDREYQQTHKKECKARAKKWKEENLERLNERKTAWYLKNKDTEAYKEKRRLASQERREKFPEKVYASHKKCYDKRRKANPDVALALRLRNGIRKALKRDSAYTNSHLKDLLGMPIPEFRIYFASQFKDGMTMERFLSGEIHVDHIKPLVSFDLTKQKEQEKAFHYTNLQPLWAVDNIRKGASLTYTL